MHVSVNISMTADGKVNLPGSAKLQRIGNDEDMARLKDLRKDVGAVIAGSRTIICDDVALRVDEDCRWELNDIVYPLRIAMIGHRIPSPHSNIFKPELGGTALVACGSASESYIRKSLPDITILVCGKEFRADPVELVGKLENEFGVKTLLIEGGPTVNSAFLTEDLVDRYYITVCPFIFGGEGKEVKTPFGGKGVSAVNERQFRLITMKQSEDWLFLTYDRLKY